MSGPQRIAVAGATGFVGQALLPVLAVDHEVLALTRRLPQIPDPGPGVPGVRWRQANLFSLLELERALEGAQLAYYLVHSMLPSARLTQGRFQDFDLLLADTFGRWAHKAGISRIVYLGGLLPVGETLSTHLRSRLEVEHALGSHGVPVTALRAGMVIGPHSSSFRIVERLVHRLPVMVAPSWARTPTQPIDVRDVVALLRRAPELHRGDQPSAHEVAEVGGPDVVQYRDLLETTSRELHRRRHIWIVPGLPATFSKLWVSLISRTPLALVSPLIDSLRHPMVVTRGWLQEKAGIPGRSLVQSIRDALAEFRPSEAAPVHLERVSDVRSVQRLPLPRGWSAEDVSREYLRWMPLLLWPFLKVEVRPEGHFRFFVRGLKWPLLELRRSAERSTPDRQVWYLTGGLLVARAEARERGRLEFREVLGGRWILSAVHGFRPSLPWLLYSLTQAQVHGWVMSRFGKHLARLDAHQPRALPGEPTSANRA